MTGHDPYQPPGQPQAAHDGRRGRIALVVTVAVVITVVTVTAIVLVAGAVVGASKSPGPGERVTDVVDQEQRDAARATETDADVPGTEADDATTTDDSGPVDSAPPAAVGTNPGPAIDAMIAQVQLDRESGALWEKIPDTEHNRTAVSAYLYFLTDLRLAIQFGVDDETATAHLERAQHLTELLLTEQPLGNDIEITLSDGVTFRYDGQTGEGGYDSE